MPSQHFKNFAKKIAEMKAVETMFDIISLLSTSEMMS